MGTYASDRWGRATLRLGLALAITAVLAAILSAVVWAASSVGSPVLTLSSKAAGATKVTYTVNFVATSGLLANSSTITLAAPAGTGFAPTNGCSPYVVYDDTTGATSSCLSATVSNGGATVTITAGVGANAGDTYTVIANSVANAATTGAQTLAVSTSADPTP